MDKQKELLQLDILKKYAYNLSSSDYTANIRVEALKAYALLLDTQMKLENEGNGE